MPKNFCKTTYTMKTIELKKENTNKKRLILFIFVSILIGFGGYLAMKIVKTKINKKTETKTRVHGNDNRNCRLHIVYEIYAKDSWGAKRILKYGISSQCDFITKDGNPRPEYQIPKMQQKKDYKNSKVWYQILHRNIPDRKAAKEIEQNLVNEYYLQNGRRPPEQLRPIPEFLNY